MNKKLSTLFKYLLFLGIGVFLTWWQLSKMTPDQWHQFKESLLHAHYIYIIPIFIIAILGHISRAMRWKILIEPMGYSPSTSNTFYATICGYFANTFLPRAGEILRCTLLSRYEKIPVSKLFGTILVERVFDLICYFFLVIFTFLLQMDTVDDFIRAKFLQITSLRQPMNMGMILLVLVGVALIGWVIIRWLLKKYKGHPYLLKIRELRTELKEGVMTIIRLKKRKAFLAHTLFIWATYVLDIYVGFNALSATSSLGIGAAFSVLSLVTLAMIVSPGGLGAFPVAVQQVLLVYQVDNISFGWLMWAVTTGIIIVAGIICFGLLFYQNKNTDEEERFDPRKDHLN